MRNLAIGGVIACPIIMALPPRKLDLYTLALGMGFYLSADHLCEVNYGRGLIHSIIPSKALTVDAMPTDKAREMQAKLREVREKGREGLRKEGVLSGEDGKDTLGVLEKLWMGEEKEGWKERRIEEERKALEEGKGYTDLIMEQIWDVWNWDKKKGGDGNGKKE